MTKRESNQPYKNHNKKNLLDWMEEDRACCIR